MSLPTLAELKSQIGTCLTWTEIAKRCYPLKDSITKYSFHNSPLKEHAFFKNMNYKCEGRGGHPDYVVPEYNMDKVSELITDRHELPLLEDFIKSVGECWTVSQLQRFLTDTRIKVKMLKEHPVTSKLIYVYKRDYITPSQVGAPPAVLIPVVNLEKIKQAVRSDWKNHYAIKAQTFASFMGIELNTLLGQIKHGKWDNLISTNDGAQTVFKYEAIHSAKYLNTTFAAELFDVTPLRFLKWSERGFIKKEGELWDVAYLHDKIPDLIASRSETRNDYDKLLGEKINQLIESYLKSREEGTILVCRFTAAKYQKITTIERHRSQLQIGLFKIICERADIDIEANETFTVGLKSADRGTAPRPLSDIETIAFLQERKKFEDAFFNDIDVDSDIDALKINILSSANWWNIANFVYKPFFLWFYDRERSKASDRDEFDDHWSEILKRLTPAKTKTNMKRAKITLTRSEIVKVFYAINQKNTQHALMWAMGALAGVRPVETLQLRIEHFYDPETGRSWLNKDGFVEPDLSIRKFYDENGSLLSSWGYARMFMPDEISKHGSSGSKEGKGTLIVPTLVSLINKHLQSLYEKCERRGFGYLFRKDPGNPMSHYSYYTDFISPHKQHFDFLSEFQSANLITKTGRRSMNNIIRTTKQPQRDVVEILRASQIQMRHKEIGLGSVSDKHYTDSLNDKIYIDIIDKSIGYPLDLEELVYWEMKHDPQNVADETEDFIPNGEIPSANNTDITAAIETVTTPDTLLDDNLEELASELRKINAVLLMRAKKKETALREIGFSSEKEADNRLKAISDRIKHLKKVK